MRSFRGLQCIYNGWHGKLQGGLSGGPLACMPLLAFPTDLQRHILGLVPLRSMAQLACLNKELRNVYLDRVKQRDAVLVDLLGSHFTPESREGLCRAHLALPRDLIVDPPVDPLALCPPAQSVGILPENLSFLHAPGHPSTHVRMLGMLMLHDQSLRGRGSHTSTPILAAVGNNWRFRTSSSIFSMAPS